MTQMNTLQYVDQQKNEYAKKPYAHPSGDTDESTL